MAYGRKTGGRQKGTPNKETVRVQAALVSVIPRFEQEMQVSFDGDAVEFLQTIYRDPSMELGIRIDAASRAARYERPALSAVAIRDVTPASSSADARKLVKELLLGGGGHALIRG